MRPLGSILVASALATISAPTPAQEAREVFLDGSNTSKCTFRSGFEGTQDETLQRVCNTMLSPNPPFETREERDKKFQAEMDTKRLAINLFVYSIIKDISPVGVRLEENNGMVFSENKEIKNDIARNPVKIGLSNTRYKVSGNVLGTISGDSKGRHLELKLIADFNL